MEVKLLFAALFATNAIDTVATHVALNHGVLEANPLVLVVLDSFGIAGLALMKLAFIMALGVCVFWNRPESLLARSYLWIATLMYTALAVYHGWGLSSVTDIS